MGQEQALPAGLRDRVLAAAQQARPTGHALPEVPVISPAEAFCRAADAFHGLLCALAEADWRRPVLRDLDVQGLVGHLTGVEEDVHRCLAGDPAVAAADHIASTQAAALRQAGRSPAQTRAEWRAAADETLRLAGASGTPGAPGALDAMAGLHGMELPVSALLVVRAFELWTHENDVRRAAGLPESVPDPSTLRLMTDLAARLLPHVGAGLPEPVDVRLVLTGPGGGTWDVIMGGRPPAPAAVSIVADAVGFCRLVANRIAPGDLDVSITGDPARAAAILAAATALALD
jgi:uncharacterized protein (TIGR03083 family)